MTKTETSQPSLFGDPIRADARKPRETPFSPQAALIIGAMAPGDVLVPQEVVDKLTCHGVDPRVARVAVDTVIADLLSVRSLEQTDGTVPTTYVKRCPT